MVVSKQTSIPQWACIINTLPIVLLISPTKIPAKGDVVVWKIQEVLGDDLEEAEKILKEATEMIKDRLNAIELDDYDYLIQLCDSIAGA